MSFPRVRNLEIVLKNMSKRGQLSGNLCDGVLLSIWRTVTCDSEVYDEPVVAEERIVHLEVADIRLDAVLIDTVGLDVLCEE